MGIEPTALTQLAPGPLYHLRLAEVVEALHHAGTNPRVKGLVTCIGDDQSFAGPAQVQELRNAVFNFRKLKKDKVPTVAFSESFGEGGGSATLHYYLARSFEQICLPKDGHVSLPGFAVTGFFASSLLAKWGVKADVFAVGKYKDFVTPFLDVKFNKANREATMGYLTSWKEQLVEDIAADRGLSPQEASAAMHMSPLTTAEAVSAGLITGDRWRHDAMNYITHFPDAQQPSVLYNMALDPSAWRAACDSHTVGDFVAGAQARAEADGQLHNGVRAHVAPMHGKSSTSGSAGLIISVKILVSHTQSAPPSTA